MEVSVPYCQRSVLPGAPVLWLVLLYFTCECCLVGLWIKVSILIWWILVQTLTGSLQWLSQLPQFLFSTEMVFLRLIGSNKQKSPVLYFIISVIIKTIGNYGKLCNLMIQSKPVKMLLSFFFLTVSASPLRSHPLCSPWQG